MSGIEALSRNLPESNIKTLNMANCGLGPESIKIIAASLTKNGVHVGLESVDLSWNRLIGLDESGRGTEDQTGWEAFCDELSNTRSIKSFKATNCGLNPKAIKVLASNLPASGLDALDVGSNCLVGLDWRGRGTGDDVNSDPIGSYRILYGWEELCEALQTTANVKTFKAADSQLGPEAIIKLASTVSEGLSGLEALDVSNNRFDPSLLDGIKHRVKLNCDACRPR